MANKTTRMMGADGSVYKVILVDTGTVDVDNQPLYRLAVDSTLVVGDIEIGAVELKNAADDTRAKVGPVSGLAVGDNGIPVAATLLAGAQVIGKIQRDAVTVSPVTQVSTNAMLLVAGSQLDTLNHLTASYTVKNDGADSIDYEIRGGNLASFADAVVVQAAATILAAGYGSYATPTAPWRYYGVFIMSTVPATPGSGLVVGVTKG